ncbi:MAG: MFS transporter [Candidatus Thermoplasmatota archaeon]|nr:MFS transporter [Candidatus Thermoplasmatota archaeon]
MGIKEKAVDTYRTFIPQFWVVISLELFERGAYYGIMGYFAYHLKFNLGISPSTFGIMFAVLLFLLYFVPIISASLARKIGYKTILTGAFLLMIPSYFIMTFARSEYAFFPLILLWGIGAGAFKPMVSATIAHVTEKKHRNLAYSIYYLTINWGSAIAMFMIGVLIPKHFAALVFTIGGILIVINLLITIFLYRNPIEKDPTEKISTAFVNMGRVLSDRKFAILLLIYSGFFFIFSSMHTFLPVYMEDFGLTRWPITNTSLMGVINPITIVSLGPFLSKVADKHESLRLMITGMAVFSIGLALLGLFPAWYTLWIGIVIFSIGEFLTHPNFISYVSKIAPEEKVALYMGYAFLPSAAGNVFGSAFGGFIYEKVAINMEAPKMFWAIYVGIGLLTIGNFLLYNRFMVDREKRAVVIKKDLFTFRWSFLGVWAVIPLIVLAGISLGTTDYVGGGEGDDEKYVYDLRSVTISYSGTLSEGRTDTHELLISEENVRWVNITLSWSDEPDQTFLLRTFENQPDLFEISFTPCNATEISADGANGENGDGELFLSHNYDIEPDHTNGTGIHTIAVTLVDVGDYQSRFDPPISLPGRPSDTGNSYDVQVTYLHLVKVEKEGTQTSEV